MKKFLIVLLVLGSIVVSTIPPLKAGQSLTAYTTRIDYATGLGFRFLNRTITWDNKEHSSSLKASIITAQFSFSTDFGVTLTPIIGIVFHNFDNLIFRQLPISVELEVGNMSGWIFGGDLSWNFIDYSGIGAGVKGEFLYALGNTNNWAIPGLAVEGNLQGKPTWWQARVGPVITYTGLENLTPFLWTGLSPLRGNFSLEETIETLQRTEDKELQGKSLVFVTLGSTLNLSSINVIFGLDLFPSKDGLDTGASLQIMYSF